VEQVDIVTILLISLGLSMDAFAVAVGVGILYRAPEPRQIFRLSFHFGLFQAFMPVIGWLAGLSVEKFVESYDHWVAFGLLALIGGRMIVESLHREKESTSGDPTRGMSLVILSIATSIDALAVGFSLALLRISIWFPSCVIGVVTLMMTIAGIFLGRHVGKIFGKRVGAVGGFVLLLIGLKILIEHLGR
jgi:manganese efflux pump family protein